MQLRSIGIHTCTNGCCSSCCNSVIRVIAHSACIQRRVPRRTLYLVDFCLQHKDRDRIAPAQNFCCIVPIYPTPWFQQLASERKCCCAVPPGRGSIALIWGHHCLLCQQFSGKITVWRQDLQHRPVSGSSMTVACSNATSPFS